MVTRARKKARQNCFYDAVGSKSTTCDLTWYFSGSSEGKNELEEKKKREKKKDFLFSNYMELRGCGKSSIAPLLNTSFPLAFLT